MVDDSIMPGWQCVTEEGDADLVCSMLANHGVEAEILPVARHGYRYSQPTVWVRDADFERAAALVDAMAHEMENPPLGFPWRCSGCMEENEPQFDICWKCERDKTTS